MKTKIFLAASMALTLGLTNLALAHEHDTFQINNQTYVFTVGSLNEPIAVDDKTGVYLQVKLLVGGGMGKGTEMDHDNAPSTPVTNLEKTLKVEISAGG